MVMRRERLIPLVLSVALVALAATLLGCSRAPQEPELAGESAEPLPAEPTEAPPAAADREQPAEAGEGPAAAAAPEAAAEPSKPRRPDQPGTPAPQPAPKPATPTPTTDKPRAPAAEPAGAEGQKPQPEQPRAQQPSASVAGTEPQPDKPQGIVVIGQIEVVSNVPDPSEVPYDTCVTFIKYRVDSCETGHYDAKELLAVFWGMRDGKLKPAARFSVGQRHRLTIEPFSERSELARVMQADDTNEYSLTPYWVTEYADGR
jgi:hypothetical protein